MNSVDSCVACSIFRVLLVRSFCALAVAAHITGDGVKLICCVSLSTGYKPRVRYDEIMAKPCQSGLVEASTGSPSDGYGEANATARKPINASSCAVDLLLEQPSRGTMQSNGMRAV